jgi:hypothetical protein
MKTGSCGLYYVKTLIGVWRHDEMCKPGLSRVVICGPISLPGDCFDAVIDDFGNLVKVPACLP